MSKLRWWGFKAQFNKWLKKNYLKPKDVDRTYLAMQASMFRTAPHVFQPVFEALFGPIDPKFLTSDIADKCNELRSNYSKQCLERKKLNLEPWIAHRAVQFTNHCFGFTDKTSFTPLSAQEASEVVPGDTSSGAPDYHTPKRDELPRVLSVINKLFSGEISLPQPVDFWPVTLAWRTQMRLSGEKHRIIAMFPQFVTILEAMFFFPILEYLTSRKGETWYSIACCWMDNAEIWRRMQKFRWYLELDYSLFDLSVRNQLIALFYQNFKQYLRLDSFHGYLYDWIAHYHLEASIINSVDGVPAVITEKQGVVLSGSYVTNLADSWINLFVISYSLIKLGYEPDEYFGRIMGDDVVIAGNYPDADVLLDSLELVVNKVFGMTISDKSAIRSQGEPFFYMGFLMNDTFKYMSEDLIKRKLTITGRFIPEDDLPNKLVVWSKFCSICSAPSNGYAFWLKYKDALLQLLDMEEPTYFHDLTEGPGKPFRLDRIVENAEEYVRTAWKYS